MIFNSRKSLFFVGLMFFTLLVSFGSVCAADTNNTDNYDDIDVVNTDDVSVCVNGSFDDLKADIGNLSPGDVFDVSRDYVFERDDMHGNGGIVIGVDNVTINGNGHVIDGNFRSALFKVTGDNVKIFNLTFVNSLYHGFYNILEHDSYGNWITDMVLGQRVSVMYTDDVSPVCWLGDNGLISDCVFSSNGALNGGALTWMGNNGVINNTLFVNNTARGVGGAVYMGGMNNTIANTTFVNSSSLLSCEAIYFDRRHGDYILSNVDFNQDVWVIDGVYSGIDVDYLKYAYYSQVGDKWINLIPLLYQSIVNNDVSYFDSETYCIARNDNFNDTGYGSVFTLSILTDFNRDSIVYQKDYLFINATFNSVFSSLLGGSFTNSFAVVKNVYVNDLGAYENLCKADVYGLVTNTESMNIIRQEFIWNAKNLLSPFTFCLNVSFAPGAVFNSNSAFDVGNYFNVINIVGNGARIQASTAKDDEYTWITNDYKSYSISNLVIDGFNHGIFNYGMCILDNVTFENNHIVFSFAKKDWGAAILNVGTCICYNCTFANNIANSGGAIYNQGRLTIENCSFYSNDVEPSFFNSIGITAGGVGVDICNLQGKGVVYAAQKIDYAEVTGFDVLEIAAVSAASVALSFVAGVGIGYAVGSVKVGAVVGGVVGACIGAIGSLVVCYNVMDATFNDLKFSLLLMGGSMTAGAIGGALGGLIAQVGNYVPEYAEASEGPIEYSGEDVKNLRIDINGKNCYYRLTGSLQPESITPMHKQAIASKLLEMNIDLNTISHIEIYGANNAAVSGVVHYYAGRGTAFFALI